MAGERLQKALKSYQERYLKADRKEKTRLLDEFCKISKYHRKHAIRLLSKPAEGDQDMPIRRRGKSYSSAALKAIEAIWKASGYPWSSRLKELLALWMPWARQHLGGMTDALEREILSISARQIDRRARTEETAAQEARVRAHQAWNAPQEPDSYKDGFLGRQRARLRRD